jgi:hypothetical protein
MKLLVIRPISVKSSHGVYTYAPGATLTASEIQAEVLKRTGKVVPLPYLDDSGDVVIPFDSDPRFQWWAGGQTLNDTLRELENELA